MSRFLVAAVALCISVAAPRALALDARQIFESVAPSTVQIRSLDSGGSGIVLNDKGLILTNYHVVASQIDLKVKAKVRMGGKVVAVEIADVTLLKVHPTYDLALLQVKAPPGASFLPARIIPKDSMLAPGMRCFAIGNPGGPDGTALDLSITEGIVSSASRQMEGLSYIQFSAAINPGNSGGPVCDDQGRVLGVATWKMTESEGLGFAIPTSKIAMADFVDRRAKKPDPALAQRAEEMGNRYTQMAIFADERDSALLLLAAVECFRIVMQATPDSPAPYIRLAVIYQRLGALEIAKKYAEGALKLAPNDGWVCHLYGEIALQGHENDKPVVDLCFQVWWRGLTNEADKSKAAWCADDIGYALQKQGKAVPAAYMLRWAEVLFAGSDKDTRSDVRRLTREALQEGISEDEIDAIRNKEDGFTQAEFASLLAGKSLTAGKPPAAPIPSVTPDQMEQIVRRAAQEFGPTQVAVPAEGLTVPLPDTPERAILAYAGWKVVITFPDLLKLGIFNLATGKIDGFIDCDDRRVLLAAGGQLLATYSPSSQMLDVYDLGTLKKIISQKNPRRGPITFIGMGLLNPSRLFVLHHEKFESYRYFAASFLKLPDLAAFDLRPSIKNGNNPLWDSSIQDDTLRQGSMDETGRVAAVRNIGDSADLDQYTPKEGSRLGFHRIDDTYDDPRVSHGGGFVLARGFATEFGTENDRYKIVTKGVNPYKLVNVAGYPAFAEYLHTDIFQGFRIFGLPAMNLLVTTPISVEMSNRTSHVRSEDQTETMLASAYCDRLVFVGAPGSETAQPGKTFSRKLNLPEGSSVKVQSGPPGIQLDEKTGTLSWAVPVDFKTGQTVQVIMLIKKADATESYAVEKILVP